MFHLGIFAESGANIVHVGVQFIFGNIKCGRVDIYSFEIYQVGRQLEQCIYILRAIFICGSACSVTIWFSITSSSGAFINVSGVRMSWAVLMKSVFFIRTFFCLCSMMIRNMILVTSTSKSTYPAIAHILAHAGGVMII